MLHETDRFGFDAPARPEFHPELRRAARFLPRFSFGRASVRLLAGLLKRRPLAAPPVLADVSIRDEYIERPGDEPLRVRIYAPTEVSEPRPALLWIHGGGFILGYPEYDQAQSIEFCRRLGIVVIAVKYRFGPDHPYPEPLEDSYDALAWLHAQAAALNIDPARVAVGGPSAGAGLAAGLALLAQDRDATPIAFQLLIYPMLDDRTTRRTDIDERWLRVWSNGSNLTGWRTYLGREPGGESLPAYAAPARRADLSGLPPAWVGIGTCDLFLDESIAYAARLNAAGVPCTLKIVPGAFHAFDLVASRTAVATDFRESYFEALRIGLRASRVDEMPQAAAR